MAYKLDKWINHESGIRNVFTMPKPVHRYLLIIIFYQITPKLLLILISKQLQIFNHLYVSCPYLIPMINKVDFFPLNRNK